MAGPDSLGRPLNGNSNECREGGGGEVVEGRSVVVKGRLVGRE